MTLYNDETFINTIAFHFPLIQKSARRKIAEWFLIEDRMSSLFLCVHQSHPTQEHIAESLALLDLSVDSFPASMFKKNVSQQELKVILKSNFIEQRQAAIFMLTLLHFRDMHRRSLSVDCEAGSCHHSWHSLELRSEPALRRALSLAGGM